MYLLLLEWWMSFAVIYPAIPCTYFECQFAPFLFPVVVVVVVVILELFPFLPWCSYCDAPVITVVI